MRSLRFIRGAWRLLGLAVSLAVVSPTLSAQKGDGPKWQTGVATGPSFFYGAEANTVGLLLEVAQLRRLNQERTWLRLDLLAHSYGAQPVYPCLLSANGVCFSTSERAIFGVSLGVQHYVRDRQEGRSTPYVVLGAAGYASVRVARQHPTCTPSAICPTKGPRHDFQDTDYGVNLGLGQTWRSGTTEFFVESRLHQPLVREKVPNPLSRFRFFPLVIGFRF